uniref:KIB1-4 beta-propeller domain-containing protein n=2 Tax=Chenopodium quinoa TaxID=63459 RepID=A0A803L8A9_CHEQI
MNPMMKKSFPDRHISWSELPKELISLIAGRFNTRDDIHKLRSICKTWQASAPLSLVTMNSILSHFLPIQFPAEPELPSTPRVLMASSVFLLRSATNPELPPYLLSVEEFSSGKLTVRFPLSDKVNDILPRGFPKALDISQFIVSELGTFVTTNLIDSESSFKRTKNGRRPTNNKAILFVDPYYETPLSINDCSVVEMSNSIALFVTRLGNMETHKVTFKGRKIEDIVSYKGRIYAMDRTGKICYIDYHSLKTISVAEDSVCAGAGPEGRKYLAAATDGLFLVYRWWRKNRPGFKIFKLNEDEERWDYHQGIGDDRILFVNWSGCFFASPKDFPGWRGNSIVFPGDSFRPYSGQSPDQKIFKTQNYDRRHDVAVYHFDSGECFLASSNPVYFNIVRPLPAWLWAVAGNEAEGVPYFIKQEVVDENEFV